MNHELLGRRQCLLPTYSSCTMQSKINEKAMVSHPDTDGRRSSDAKSIPQPLSQPLSLVPISTSTTTIAPEAHGPSSELAHERQTLLLMLLGQVCSLHDATPRTFVVHVVALYERGILDSHSIRFLFDLGLIPKGYGLSPSSASETIGGSSIDHEGRNNDSFFSPTSHWCEEDEDATTSCLEGDNIDEHETETTEQGAIVPFSEALQQQPWNIDLPTPSTQTTSTDNSCTSDQSRRRILHSTETMSHRQKEALAIRQHLELHEPILDTSSYANGSSSLDSANGNAGSATPTSYPSVTTFSNGWKSRSNSSTTPNTMPNIHISSQQLTTHMPQQTSSSWAVEHHPLSLSRYQREFHQLSLLATGSFGAVYSTIHKLEQRPYAVKCVTFSTMGYYADTLSLVMREVRCLAQLNHPNCVRYYTSWLEPSWMTGEQKESFENDDELDVVGEYVVNNANNNDGGGGGPKLLEEIERVIEGLHNTELNTSVEQFDSILYSDMDDGFHWTTSSSPERSPDVAVEDSAKRPNYYEKNHRSSMYSRSDSSDDGNNSEVSEWTQDINRRSESTTGDDRSSFHNSQAKFSYTRSDSVELVRAEESNHRRHPYKKSTSSSSTTYKYQISLYIQMQLCKPTTLADWIHHRNNRNNCIDFDAKSAFSICGQIVNGLSHVHSKGIIHRDLKPANIFAGDDGMFMIGDFGLSKMMKDANHHAVDIDLQTNAMILSDCSDIHHTAGVGTASYASPEQIESKSYGTAADVYSLGLIILELFSNFTSEHERAKAFLACRRDGELDSGLKHYFPEVATLILACTNKDCSRRPTARDIQAEFQERSGDEMYRAEVRTLKLEIAKKDKLIQSQVEQMRAKDKLIEKLENKLASLESDMDATAVQDPADGHTVRN